MKFAHLADCHIGAWRKPKIQELNVKAFLEAVSKCIEENVDFILIAGDLFNTALPSIDLIDKVAESFKTLKDEGISVYVIPGSHDFSPSGKTMIKVLESTGLITNVCKGKVNDEKLELDFTIDEDTGVKITGMIGKKGMLDKEYYHDLDREKLEGEDGYKIFMFHTSLSELKPKYLEEMESQPVSLLPKGFDYYAGGHVHHKNIVDKEDYGLITQPGALFPNNFREMEKFGHGGFFIVEDGEVDWKPVKLKDRISIDIDCDNKTPQVVEEEIKDIIDEGDVEDSIITIRLEGELNKGKVSDISFRGIFNYAYSRDAYSVIRNTSKLQSEDFEEIKVKEDSSVEEVEKRLIKEHVQQVDIDAEEKDEISLTSSLMNSLDTNKKEGETNSDFEERVEGIVKDVLDIE